MSDPLKPPTKANQRLHKPHQGMVAAALRSVFDQEKAAEIKAS